MKFKYLEIIEKETKEVAERFDVTGKSDRSIEQLKSGVSINLNHSDYRLKITDSDVELQTNL